MNKKLMVLIVVTVMATVVLVGGRLALAEILYVDDDNCPGPGTGTLDDPFCTIQAAVDAASPGGDIYVAEGTYTGTDEEVVFINKDLRLFGGWDSTFSSQQGTTAIDGEGERTGIKADANATIDHFEIRNAGGIHYGSGVRNYETLTLSNCLLARNGDGGIRNLSGEFTLNDSIVSQNTGGIANDNDGTVTLNNSVVSGNSSEGSGAGIGNSGTMTLNNSVVSGNFSGNFGPGSGGAGIFNDGILILNNSTVSNNVANGDGGGIRNYGGYLILNNSTISGNSAFWGGGICSSPPFPPYVFLFNCTVSDNASNEGGGGISGGATLKNSIVAGNRAIRDVYGNIDSAGYNVIQATRGNCEGCTLTFGPGDKIGVDAKLGSLVGSPGYHPLRADSPAIDAGDPSACMGSDGPLNQDQRGVPRSGRCDIGSYEYTAPGPAASVVPVGGSPRRTPPYSPFEYPLQAAVLDSVGSPVPGIQVTFVAPTSGASATFGAGGPNTTDVATDGCGVSTSPAVYANGQPGTYTVTATADGVAEPVMVQLTNFGWYVAPGGNDAEDCLTSVTPCATISGVSSKPEFAAGDTILLAAGTYVGDGDEVALITESMRILGGWDPTFLTQDGMSTLDGQATRRGLTVQGDLRAVGGIATVFIERVAVQNGFAGGGGISNEGGGDLTLNNCVVANNGTDYRSGGGIANAGRLIVMKSTITGNMTSGNQWGGGVVNGNYLEVWDSVVSGNTAGAGGGIYNNALAKILNSTISGNEDGGFFNSVNSGTALLINNTISGNNGAGIINYSSVYVDNCTITYNQGPGIFYSYFPAELNLTVTNSILWGNSPDQIYIKYDPPSVTYSDIEGGWVGEGNISEDPRFVDPGGGDFHMEYDSPCIDKGTNAAELLDTDLDGDPRIFDGDNDGIATVDIGSDEYIPFTLIAPNGGEVIPSGSRYPIRWLASSKTVNFKLKYSMDNGKTWKPIASEIADTSYDWAVPPPPKNKTKCLVKVIGYNASGKKVAADSSDASFTIEVLTVTSPSGGEICTSGDPYTITWTTHETKKDVAKVILKYTKNGGQTWKKITAIEGSNPETHLWTVPDVPKTKSKCSVKVVLKDAKGNTVASDASDGYFTIQP